MNVPAHQSTAATSRRTFIKGSLAGGFLLAFHLPAYGVNEPNQPPDDTTGKFSPNAFIRIDKAGKTTLVMPQVEQWKVDPSSCSTSNSEVTHTATRRSLSYGVLADAASKETPPKNPPLKDPKNFTLIGKAKKRFDTPGKVDGSALYGIDAILPGMKFATLVAAPVLGGKVGKIDDAAAKQVLGVQKVSLQLNSGNGALWKSTRWESFLPRASCLRLTSVYLININALRNIRNLI